MVISIKSISDVWKNAVWKTVNKAFCLILYCCVILCHLINSWIVVLLTLLNTSARGNKLLMDKHTLHSENYCQTINMYFSLPSLANSNSFVEQTIFLKHNNYMLWHSSSNLQLKGYAFWYVLIAWIYIYLFSLPLFHSLTIQTFYKEPNENWNMKLLLN